MLLLSIETSGLNCSVALSKDNRILAEKSENAGKFTHSENLHLFIEAVMQQASMPLSALDAIAVSAGAGSYTGLRIGIATAKGLCFALGKPLIAIPTLQILAHQAKANCIIPMLDARRMEVYSAVFAAICKHPNAVFIPDAFPQAKDMIPFAMTKYNAQDFEDIAYFEPTYLK